MNDAVRLESLDFDADGSMQQPAETEALLREGRGEREAQWGAERSGQSWWRKQSPWWALVAGPLLTATIGLVMAPKIEVYTALACMKHKPELFETLVGSATELMASTAPLPRICSTDPEIRTVVAKLSAAETTMLGVLSCLTTGWWASLSDRRGRKTLFFISAFGMLCANIIYILVNRFWKTLPYGYWCILLGPLIEGSFGGMPASLVAFVSYCGDTTPERKRSRMLSINFGLYWAGVSLGPLVASLAMRLTDNIISVFYTAIVMQAAFLLYTRLIMLEPLSEQQQRQAKDNLAKHREEERLEFPNRSPLGKLFTPFLPIVRPLTALKPVKKVAVGSSAKQKKDWNLLLAALSLGCLYVIAADLPFKFQYATGAFGWGAKENGFFLSALSLSRGVYLTMILPVIIKLFKPPTREVKVSVESDTEPSGFKTITEKLESPTFDLRLARISILIEGSVHVVMLLFPSPASLYILGVVGTCGAGFPPSVQSVILSLYIEQGGQEIGKIFGALGVIQTLCGAIISPVLYGLIYVATVTVFPMSIFVASLTAILLSFSIICLVRMPTHDELIAKRSGATTPSATLRESVDSI